MSCNRYIRVLAAMAVVLVARANAQQEEARLHVAAVKAAIEYPLPSAGEVLGADVRRAAPVIVIADFNEGETDCKARALGQAIGATLRVEAWGLSKAISFSQPTGYWSDRRIMPDEKAEAGSGLVARRVGAQWILRGSAEESETGIRIQYRLVRADTGADDAVFEQHTDRAHLNSALADGIVQFLAHVPARVADGEQARIERLRDAPAGTFARMLATTQSACEGARWADEIERAWNDFPAFPVLGALYAEEVRHRHVGPSTLSLLTEITEQSGAHPVVRAVAAHEAVYASPQYQNDVALADLKSLAREYSQEPMAIDAASDALAAENFMYATPQGDAGMTYVVSGPAPHHPGYAQALALALWAVTAWPEDYRSWWCLAFALSQYMNAIRGTEFWDKVPESAKHRYPKLASEMDYALSRALQLQPPQINLWKLQISSDVQAGRDWMPDFKRAVLLAPHDADLYRTGFNYAEPQWGGSSATRRTVYELARESNPDQPWPARMYRDWVPGWESFWVIHRKILLLAAVLVVVALLAVKVGRESSPR